VRTGRIQRIPDGIPVNGLFAPIQPTRTCR
jgi:hypothetical protein